jgi:hypothetical protein
MMNLEDYDNMGLQLKRLLRHLNKFPSGCSAFLLHKDLSMSIDETRGLIKLAIAASCGIKVVVETHSDHLLNCIRLPIAWKSKDITRDLAK